MLAPRWNKVIRDLWGNKLRTLLVVLAIAAGGFAFGIVATSRDTMLRELGNAYLATNPAHIRMSLSPFDEDLIHAVEGMREVAQVEGRAIMDWYWLNQIRSTTIVPGLNLPNGRSGLRARLSYGGSVYY